MNYRHAFHAGNFADVVKHIVLTRVLAHLQEKPAPFRVVDSHAGAGLYDLTSEEAQRGGEWREGIAQLLSARLDDRSAVLLQPYLDIVRSFNPADAPVRYPGSPLIARAMLRPQDRLVACEAQPQTCRALIQTLRRDEQARVVEIDGWMALTAYLPPKERRGVVLIDPPFEQPDEFDRFAATLQAALRKWVNGIYVLWYPVKDLRAAGQFASRVAQALQQATPGAAAHPKALREKCLRIEFDRGAGAASGLNSAGLIVVNPPWKLRDEMSALAPLLGAALGRAGRGQLRLDHPSA